MIMVNNEFERSQLGAAHVTGDGATQEKLKPLRRIINNLSEIARRISDLILMAHENQDDFLDCFVKIVNGANEALAVHVEEIKHGQGMEDSCMLARLYRDKSFWTFCKSIGSRGQQEIYQHLNAAISQLKSLLEEVKNILRKCDPVLFEKFFFDEKKKYSDEGVKGRFEHWMYDLGTPSTDDLTRLQTLVVADALKQGIMDFTPLPTQEEMDQVRLDILKGLLPFGYETDCCFLMACARWRRFIHWRETILIIDYKKFGRYIHCHFDELSANQLLAIFELDMMLHLIHQEMIRQNPELADKQLPAQTGSLENSALFAPYITITRMLQQEWFDEVSTDKQKYTAAWREKLVNNLMKSECGTSIADEWQKPDKRQKLKAAVAGCLKMAGAIEGSNLGIAGAIVGGDATDRKTFAIYMGKGKKEPMAEWICNYVKD